MYPQRTDTEEAMPKPKLNGSTDLLARAMRQVLSETVAEAVNPLEKKIDSQGERLERVEKRIDDVTSEGVRDAAN